MDHQYIRDNQIADRYAQGHLPVEECTAFEAHLVDCPECLASIDLAESLGDGLRAAKQAERVTVLTARPARRWLFAAAVLAAAAMVAVMVVREPAGTTPPPPAIAMLSFTLSASRAVGDTPAAEIRLPAERREVELNLETPGASEFPAYRATLLRDGAEVFSADGLKASGPDSVGFKVDSSLLVPGRMTVRLEGITGDQRRVPISEFAFAIVR